MVQPNNPKNMRTFWRSSEEGKVWMKTEPENIDSLRQSIGFSTVATIQSL